MPARRWENLMNICLNYDKIDVYKKDDKAYTRNI